VKKSELKKRLVEALTPDEAAKVEPKYKETYAAMIKGKGPLKLKKYDNPDKVVRGRVVNTIKNESLKIAEKLGKKAKVGDYIEDFTDSDAPQFKGKSDKKKKQMAVAAFLNKEEQKLDEIDAIMEKEEKLPVNDIKKAIKALLKKEGGAAGLAPILKLAKDFDNVTQIDVEDILDNDMKDVEKHRDGDYILKETGQEISKKNMDDYKRLNELVKAALMGPINETLDDKVYDLVDRMLDAMGGSDNLLKELIRAMSTKDAMFYLSAIARDYGMFDDAEEISEKQASTDKYDKNPALTGKQSELPDGLQKAIIKKSKGKDAINKAKRIKKEQENHKAIVKDKINTALGYKYGDPNFFDSCF